MGQGTRSRGRASESRARISRRCARGVVRPPGVASLAAQTVRGCVVRRRGGAAGGSRYGVGGLLSATGVGSGVLPRACLHVVQQGSPICGGQLHGQDPPVCFRKDCESRFAGGHGASVLPGRCHTVIGSSRAVSVPCKAGTASVRCACGRGCWGRGNSIQKVVVLPQLVGIHGCASRTHAGWSGMGGGVCHVTLYGVCRVTGSARGQLSPMGCPRVNTACGLRLLHKWCQFCIGAMYVRVQSTSRPDVSRPRR